MRCVIVATWGDPFAWREARYRMMDSSDGVESITSLSLLKENLSPDKMIILVPETLLSPSQKSAERIRKYSGRLLEDSPVPEGSVGKIGRNGIARSFAV